MFAEEFCRKFVERASRLKTGNPLREVVGSTGTPDAIGWVDHVPDESVYYGPIINEQGFAKIRRMNSLVASDPRPKYLARSILGQRNLL